MINVPINYTSHIHKKPLLTLASIEDCSFVRDPKIRCYGKKIYCNLAAVVSLIVKFICSEIVAELFFE
jgi:hypothetical protein